MLPGTEMGVQSGSNPGGGGGGGGFGSFSVVFNPASVEETRSGTSSSVVTSNFVTVYPSGGVAPYSVEWSFQSGFSIVTADYPTSDSTTFSAMLAPGQTREAIMRATVTDAAMAVSYADIPVSLTLISRNTNLEAL